MPRYSVAPRVAAGHTFLASTLWTALGVGIDTLKVNPLRTALSTLGIVIGVASLVAVLAIGDGMERYMRSEIERTTGVQTVYVSPKTTETVDGQAVKIRDYPVFTSADARAAAAEIPNVSAISLSVSGSGIVETMHGGRRRGVSISAATASSAEFGHLEFTAGRFFTDAEAERNHPVAVISHRLAKELSESGNPADMVGRDIRLAGSPRRVVGVLEPIPGESKFGVMIPLRGAASSLPPGTSLAPTMMLRAARVEDVDLVKSRAEDWLARHYERWERRAKVETQLMRLEQTRRGLTQFKAFMGAITGISLIVGGIGIMNVLLASVQERTREIGIRKATGARYRDVLFQFLAESVAISGFGSAIGLVLGFIGAVAITAVMRSSVAAVGLRASLTVDTVLIAALSSIVVGLTFGTYPARRAARLSPIDAIRHE